MLKDNPIFHQFLHDDNINHGGCGLYALAVARYLNREYSGVDIQLAVCGRDSYQLNQIKHNNNIINNVPSHVVVLVDGLCIDSEGVLHLDEFETKWEERYRDVEIIDFDEKAMIEALNQPESWNTWFNRHDYLSVFEQHFNVKLDDVLLEV